MKAADLRAKTPADLEQEHTALLRQHFALRMQKSAGQSTDTSQLRKVRRNIARLKQVISEKSGGTAA